ncbi:V-type ATP synthase subunit A [Candidatus Bathyarchaeota archaeon]|nr:MAG: V-type ATP synthase subunit A [Candidatus Bathyarchaeota archaeon]
MPDFKPGKVARVAGPVIVAEGMLGAQMHEVVRVGDLGLIGEIIKIDGENATVQVYEETAGLRPGEKVERTGKPLSVELGPGILGQIYDGIQRPLTVLFEKTGPFIKRGLAPAAIDRSKKWHFVPTADRGVEVSGGDVLGTVKETTLITQRIMVPPNQSGKIISIVPEGDYTITEPIGELETKTGPVSLFMMHTWPVRIARPFKRKLPSEIPLITGQRIIDFFFPVAKGGTAAVPGPFGSGKCMDGETPVLLADGRIRRIRELVRDNGNSQAFDDNGDETLYSYSNPPRVVSLSNPEFTKAEASMGYKGSTNELLEIQTRSGRRVRVTPVHKLQQLRRDGTIEETSAKLLRPGAYLLTPRKIALSLDQKPIDPYKLLPDDTRVDDPKAIRMMVATIESLTADMALKVLARNLDVSYKSLLNCWRRRARPTLGFLRRLAKATGKKIPVGSVRAQRQGWSIKLPKEMTLELAEFLGLILSDGMLRGRGRVILFNNDKQVLRRFSRLANDLFGLTPRRGTHSGGLLAQIDSRALVHLLVGIGFPKKKKSRTLGVPDLVSMSPDKVIGGFFAGYIAGDGSFSKGTLEISTASEEMALGISYLLTRLGVLHRIRHSEVGGHTYHRMSIEGRRPISELYQFLPKQRPYPYLRKIDHFLKLDKRGYSNVDVIPIDPSVLSEAAALGKTSRKSLRKSGFNMYNYTTHGEKPGITVIRRLISAIKDKSAPGANENTALKKLEKLSELSDFSFFDEISEIRQITTSSEVYDITVPGYENFIAGWGPMVCHNTVLQQALAKFADAQVIVYVGCGERGNEMAEVLETFPTLLDPRTGQPLMNRTTLVANTSNMPIAAREASVYTGITIAEYFRDMGYDTALMADSTSRWAEALREISGRLEEMPGEEGYPAYLASRLADFYERSGRLEVLGSESKQGSISVIGAVSPPGGDFSEPITQNTLRIVKVFWALDSELAKRRHFPAINWLTSYSLYLDTLETWYPKEVGPEWVDLRKVAMYLLQRDEELREIVMLVGPDALSEGQRVILEAAKMIKEDFLMQQSYNPADSYCDKTKTYNMIRTILHYYNLMQKAVDENIQLQKVLELPVKNDISRMRLTAAEKFTDYSQSLNERLDQEFQSLKAPAVKAK